MASRSKSSSNSGAPSHIEFEPYCEWQKQQGVETLVIHLPDFKREQLRVQVTSQGVLRVSGERPIAGTQRKRFLKETKIPEGCNINDIKAKFIKGRLNVTMPKTSQMAPQDNKTEATQKPKSEAPLVPPLDHWLKAPSSNDHDQEGRTRRIDGNYQPKDDHNMFGLGKSIARLQERNKKALYFGIAAAVMVAVGAFVAYKCGSEPSCYHV